MGASWGVDGRVVGTAEMLKLADRRSCSVVLLDPLHVLAREAPALAWELADEMVAAHSRGELDADERHELRCALLYLLPAGTKMQIPCVEPDEAGAWAWVLALFGYAVMGGTLLQRAS